MCGICGQVREDGRPVERGTLEGMCHLLEHRGPDSRGTHLDGPVGLGIQRLRVIDLQTGDQPIYNEDGTVAVVLNGEIYNYRELRRGARAKGHRFDPGGHRGDRPLYEEWTRLRGPPARNVRVRGLGRPRRAPARPRPRRKEAVVLLDREGALSFASEMRALFQDEEIPRRTDPIAVDRFLTFGYVPAPRGAISGVRKLPPAPLPGSRGTG